MPGIITHIQRLSIHDGPGIRSTIFLKGCNFRCAWCHNPETFSGNPELEWISDKCINCHACVLMCESGALSVQDGLLSFNKQHCTSCFYCIDACFPEALKRVGRELSADQIFNEVEPDLTYFVESNGGITLSGGESLLQVNFAKEILKMFFNKGIHTAIQTNLSLPWKYIERLLPYLNYLMVDLKLMDETLHKQWTKAGNKKVLENILKLDQVGISYEIRTPVVPGVNDNEHSIDQIKEFIAKLKNISKHEMLPYHSLAESKYQNLGIQNPMSGVKDLTKELIEKISDNKKSF